MISKEIKIEEKEIEKGKDDCKGLFFRVEENAYYQNDVFFRSIKLKKLKRISCPGCEKCIGYFEYYMEQDSCMDFGAGIDTSNINHGDIVEPVYTSEIDFETGIDEGGDYHFRKVKENENDNTKNYTR